AGAGRGVAGTPVPAVRPRSPVPAEPSLWPAGSAPRKAAHPTDCELDLCRALLLSNLLYAQFLLQQGPRTAQARCHCAWRAFQKFRSFLVTQLFQVTTHYGFTVGLRQRQDGLAQRRQQLAVAQFFQNV